MASSRFQSAKGKTTSGRTTWMPALLTRISTFPYFATVSATPFSTCASSVTFMATAKASALRALISPAVASAALRSRSAMTGMPPSAASRSATCLPMPLAEPVIIATRPSKRAKIVSFSAVLRGPSRLLQVVEHDLAEAEGKISDEMRGGYHLAHGKSRNIALGVLEHLQGRGAPPRPLERHILQVVAHQLADARPAIDVRNDLDHEVRFGKAFEQGLAIDLMVFVAHRRRDTEHRAIMQRTHESLVLVRYLRSSELLRESPDLPAAGDRRIVIEIHRMHVPTLLAHAIGPAESHRNDLARFRVIAESGGVGHADELVIDGVPCELQRLRHDRAQRIRVGAIGDHDELPVVKLVRASGVSRVRERHCKGVRTNFGKFHRGCSLLGDGERSVAADFAQSNQARTRSFGFMLYSTRTN